jgi:hypothetical protein
MPPASMASWSGWSRNPILPAPSMTAAMPPARYSAVWARVRAASLPPSYTITWDTTELRTAPGLPEAPDLERMER